MCVVGMQWEIKIMIKVKGGWKRKERLRVDMCPKRPGLVPY
jgi:hypothetical protein